MQDYYSTHKSTLVCDFSKKVFLLRVRINHSTFRQNSTLFYAKNVNYCTFLPKGFIILKTMVGVVVWFCNIYPGFLILFFFSTHLSVTFISLCYYFISSIFLIFIHPLFSSFFCFCSSYICTQVFNNKILDDPKVMIA
jgi:hypothetical protein